MTPDLKPCPFCGGSAAYGYVDDESSPDFGGHYIQCDKCHASTHLRYASGDDPKPHLADAWNTRPSERQARDEALERLRRDLLDDLAPGDYQVQYAGGRLCDLHDLLKSRIRALKSEAPEDSR